MIPSEIFRDHPVDPNKPWVVPASYRRALSEMRNHPHPENGEPSCESGCCDLCYITEFESGFYLEVIDIQKRPIVQHFRCVHCYEEHGNA